MQRQVPAVLGLEVPHIQFVDSGWTFLLCLQRRLLTVQTVQMTVEILQLPFLDRLLTARYCATPHALFTVVTVVDIPVVTQRLSFGPDCSENHSDSPDAVHRYGGRRPCWAGPTDSTRAVCDSTVACVVFVPGQRR